MIEAAGTPLVLPSFVTGLRSHQTQAIEEIVEHFRTRNVVFLDAPTGAGKTIIGEAVRQVMRARQSDLAQALYLCTTKSLQEQFLHDFRYAKLIKGRANYPTLDDSARFELTGERHLDAGMCTKKRTPMDMIPLCASCYDSDPDLAMVRSTGEKELTHVLHCHNCHPWQHCPYEIAKSEALHADLAVANTAYLLTEANGPARFGASTKTGIPKFGMFIVDEADTLESVMMGHLQLQLTRYALRKLGLEMPQFVTKPSSWLEWAEKSLLHIEAKYKALLGSLDLYIEEAPPSDLKKEEDSLKRYVAQFGRIVHALRTEPDNWVYDGYKEGGVVLKPVTVGSHARGLLWKHGRKFLLMSATMISPRQMAMDLGLDEHEYESVVVDSNFPVERRPVWIMARANMTNKTKEEEWPKMVLGLQEILDLHPNERVLVHTHSYALTEYLHGALRTSPHGDRLLSYSEAKQRDDILETFKNRTNAVLLAPSLDRGIDLKDDLCRAIVIAKVPFPNLGDKQVNQRFFGTHSGKGWFYTETIRSLVQMTGRGMRHEDDFCVSYILDAQFPSNIWSTEMARNRLPRWWTRALKWEPPRRRV